jgi:hypothetical protein
VKGRGHMELDFHAPTKALFNLQVPATDGLKTSFRRRKRKMRLYLEDERVS